LKNVLIFGITGQDGSYLADFLLKKGYNVIGAYRKTSNKSFRRLEELGIKDDIEKVKVDLSDQASIQSVIKKTNPDEIYNLAAQSHVEASFDQPILTTDISGVAVIRILDSIRENTPDAKFYQASSSEMYGNRKGIKNETTPFVPRSAYGAAKVLGHNMTVNYREAYNIFGCCGILFNHESPLRGIEFVTRKISSEIAKIKFKKQDKLHLGNIYAKRDWGFARDYVEAMWLMMQQKKPEDYVISTGISHSVEEFLTLASEYAGLGDWQEFCVIDESLKRPTDIEESIGDSSKARSKLGWKPKIEFKELVKMMVEYDLNLEKT
jgi:GDPmannose 4,6-dehydratase